MRRTDKEINDIETVNWILQKAKVCRIALSHDNRPYIVPMIFAFKNNSLYLHSAHEGRKIDILRKNNQICFEVDLKKEVVEGEDPCKWGMRYYSVVGCGKAHFIKDLNKKKKALNIIMAKYSSKSEFEYSKHSLDGVTVIGVEITHLTGKKSGY